jgi:carboxyl-terminal processing protease
LLAGVACAAQAQLPPAGTALENALRAVLREYVDELDEGVLAGRCLEGMQSWLAGRGMRLAPTDAPPMQPLARVGDLLRRVSLQYTGIDYNQLADACLKPVGDGLDKHSSYMDRDSYRELTVGSGPVAGIGLELATEPVRGYTKIVSTIDGTPSSRADLQRDDLIVSIDGTSTQNLPLTEVVKLLRGKPGSTAVLEISRPGAPAPQRREVVRQIIRIDTVRALPLEGRLLYVRIAQFQSNTYERFLAVLREQNAKIPEGLAGVVLDLRNNSGGLLYSCAAIASAFVPETAVVVEMRGRTPDNQRKLYARSSDYDSPPRSFAPARLAEPLRGVPLAVVVNRRSAACAEILAATLQDQRRATVIGEKTFGHGTVQTILPLGGMTGIKLTTSRYYRATGAAMENNPVTPDVVLDFGGSNGPFGGADDPALPAARRALGLP